MIGESPDFLFCYFGSFARITVNCMLLKEN